jgi:hypothetical protein
MRRVCNTFYDERNTDTLLSKWPTARGRKTGMEPLVGVPPAGKFRRQIEAG